MAAPVYTVEVGWEDAVAGRFTLDSSQLDGADTLGSTFEQLFGATFGDVSEDLERFRTRRGSGNLVGPMLAGELELVLSDLDGTYNPLSTASPLAALDPGFTPMRPVRVKALFDGVSDTPLTVSGNEITDALRALGVSGDGREDDSSFGAWEATVNLAVKNLGIDPLAAATLITTGGSTLTRTALGAGWYRLTNANDGNNRICRIYAAAADLVNGQTYTCSILWKNKSGNHVLLDWCDVSTLTLGVSAAITNVDLGGGVTRSSISQARATYDATFRFFDVQLQSGASIDVKWPQIENQPLMTPYVGDAGGARAAARVQAAVANPDGSAKFTEESGAVLVFCRMGWDAADDVHAPNTAAFFEWGDDINNRFSLATQGATGRLRVQRRTAAGIQDSIAAGPVAWTNAGDLVCGLFAWTPTALKVGANGGALFSVGGSAFVPTLAATQFDFGDGVANVSLQPIDSDLLFAATFDSGDISDSEWAALYARVQGGDVRAADLSALCANANCTAVMPFDDADYYVPGETYSLFSGWIRRADFDPETRSCTIHAQDLFLWLERARPTIAAGATAVGEAIGLVLDALGWTEPTLRELADGDTLGADFTADGSKTALQLIAELLEADRGVFYIRGDGTAVYEDRHARARRRTPSATLTDVLVTSSSAIDLDKIVNRLRVTKAGGAEMVAEDTASIADYGLNEGTPILSPYLESDARADSLAAYLVGQAAEPQPPVTFEQDDPAQLIALLGLDLNDLVELDTGELGASGDFHVEQLEHEVNAPGAHHLVRVVASKRPPEVFQLDVSTLGSADTLTY